MAVEEEIRSTRSKERAKKDAWMKLARSEFSAEHKTGCAVCGMYEGVCQAHHLAPLASQYDLGVQSAAQEYTWLCPNHHSIVHAALASIASGEVPAAIKGVPLHEMDACCAIARRGSDLLVKTAVAERTARHEV